jgi:hypothetical protein
MTPPHLLRAACLGLSGYVLAAAVAARIVPLLTSLRDRWEGVPWLLPAQAVTATVALGLSLWACGTFDMMADRLTAPLAVALLVAAGVLHAHRGVAPRYVTLLLGVLLGLELGWAVLGPGVDARWLHRNVLLMTALAVGTVLYGVLLARLGKAIPEWAECGRRLGPILGVGAFVMLLVVLGQEFVLFNPAVRRTPMMGWAVAVVAAALVGLMTAQIRFAVVPGRDPFGLSEARRTIYVYLAEVLLLGLFLHVRLNLPELFGNRFVKYWTFLVMAIAFIGVGLGEFFQRRKLPVLGGPLYRTGVFLPLIPLLVFWVRPPSALQNVLIEHAPGTQPMLAALERLPAYHTGAFDRYAYLWFLLGALYAVIAVARRSPRHTLFAALAANVGLWCLFHYHGLGFLVHPQMWLVPLGLIVLVSEHLNRERLGPSQAALLRYAGLGLLYLSSTADMFLTGLGRSLVLPVVLALFSVSGVLAGILLRVRSFLLAGVGFLIVVILSMIWHAAVDLAQTWVWWASGIVLGVAILGLFALFEKRRNDVMRLVEEMRKWS